MHMLDMLGTSTDHALPSYFVDGGLPWPTPGL